jgi:hypothetical protein
MASLFALGIMSITWMPEAVPGPTIPGHGGMMRDMLTRQTAVPLASRAPSRSPEHAMPLGLAA